MRHFRLHAAQLAASILFCGSTAALAQVDVGVTIDIAPPPLPVYIQPEIPAPGYIWEPGYWAYGPDGYFWVPGTWVQPPMVGVLWTPGYWGWDNGYYVFNRGYWGPHVGFYGGINYGYGYGGDGYQGGYWNHGQFNYNRSVNNFGNTHITNVYDKTVINRTTVNNVSFNGGTGGVAARPSAQEQTFGREQHIAPTALQTQHQQAASADRDLRVSVNQGRPAIAATSRPGQFSGAGVVSARAAGGPISNSVRAGGAPQSGEAARPEVPHPPGAGARPAELARPGEAARPGETPRAQMQGTPQAPRPDMQRAPQAPRPEMQRAPQAPRPEMQRAPQGGQPGGQRAPEGPRPQAERAAPAAHAEPQHDDKKHE